MSTTRYIRISLIGILLLLPPSSLVAAEEILPLPGAGSNRTVASGEELIPLPGQPVSGAPQPQKDTPIEIPGIPADQVPPADQAPSPEIVIDPLAPDPVPPTPITDLGASTAQTGAPAGSAATYPLMPKDTSSAIFMVMKTWECQDYDLKTLIEHAASVYGQESEDRFEVKGLAELTPVTTSVKEEDVTFDELLDVVTRKHGLDWGVDVAQKTVYIYPGKKP